MIAAAVVILFGNAVVLGRVAYNRAGEPEVWTFSEREFSQPWRARYGRNRENSGMTLHLDWQGEPPEEPDDVPYRHAWRGLGVEPRLLEELGYAADHDCDAPGRRRPDRDERRAWVALELDGPAHRRHVELMAEHLEKQVSQAGPEPDEQEQWRLDRLRKRFEDLKRRDTRLYAVDLAINDVELDRRYGDGHLILPAVVSPRYDCDRPTSVYINQLFNTAIHVPRHHRAAFDRLVGQASRGSRPPFEAVVAFGRLREPWLRDIRPRARADE